MTTPTYEFSKLQSLLTAAGISVVEAARLFKVSRPTIYSWMGGTGPNQPIILATAQRIISAVELAVAAQALPLVNADPTEHYRDLVLTVKKFL